MFVPCHYFVWDSDNTESRYEKSHCNTEKQDMHKSDSHFVDFYTQVSGSHRHKLLIAVQYCCVVTFNLDLNGLIQLIWFVSCCLHHEHTEQMAQLLITDIQVTWFNSSGQSVNTSNISLETYRNWVSVSVTAPKLVTCIVRSFGYEFDSWEYDLSFGFSFVYVRKWKCGFGRCLNSSRKLIYLRMTSYFLRTNWKHKFKCVH